MMKKKLISALLMLGMAAAVLPGMKAPAEAADDPFIYSPGQKNYYPILTAEMAEDTKLVRDFDDTSLNFASLLGLNFSKMTTNASVYIDNFWDKIEPEYSFENYVDSIRFGATFTGDEHKDFWEHGFSALQASLLMSVGHHQLYGPGEDVTKTLFYSDGEFHPFNTGLSWITVRRSIYSQCLCGSPKFGKPIINFADVTGPSITGWYATFSDDMGDTAPANPREEEEAGRVYGRNPDMTDENPAAWEDVYIHLTFSENIRFADDDPTVHDNVYLGLELTSMKSHQSAGKTFYAKLYALRDNVLSFKLDTAEFLDPDSVNYLNGQEPTHYISNFTDIVVSDNINGAGAQNALNAEDAYPLEYIISGRHISDPDMDSDLTRYLLANFTHTDSVFTDVVGNPCATTTLAGIANGYYRIEMDSRHPYVEGIQMDVYDQYWQLYTKPHINGDEVNEYLKEGYHIRFTMKMSEGTNDFPSPKVVTNMKDAQGNNIILECNRWYRDNSVMYSYYSETLYQFDLNVTADMIPPTEPITIIEIVDDITDEFGNYMVENPETGELLPMASKQMRVDVLPPAIAINQNMTEDGAYVPTVIDESERLFSIDFNLADDTSHGLENASGLVGAEAIEARITLYESNSHPNSGVEYQYCITTSDGAVPADSEFQRGVTKISNKFGQITADRVNAPHKIYIKLPDHFPLAGLPLKAKIETRDYVGHITTKEITIDATALTDLLDHTSPEVTILDTVIDFKATNVDDNLTNLDNLDGTGSFKISFSVYDATEVNSDTLQYAFILDSAREPGLGDWIDAKQGFGSIVNGNTITLEDVEFPGGLGAVNTDIYFWVYAEDTTKNVNGKVYGPYLFEYNKAHIQHEAMAEEKIPLVKPELTVQFTGEVLYDNGVNQWPQAIYAWTLLRPQEPEKFFGTDGYFAEPDTYLLVGYYIGGEKEGRQVVDILNPNNFSNIGQTAGAERRSYYGKFDTTTLTMELIDTLANGQAVNYDELADVFGQNRYSRYAPRYYGKIEARYYMAEVLHVYEDENANGVYSLGFPEGTSATTGMSYEMPIYRSPVYEMWYAGSPEDAGMKVLDVSVSWEDEDLLEADPSWTPDSTGHKSLTTLAGQVINLNITPAFDVYGLDLLDKESSYIRVRDGSELNNILYSVPITEGNMRIVIPEDDDLLYPYKTGRNKIYIEYNIVLKDSEGNAVETWSDVVYDTPEIYVDPAPLTDFGVAAVVTKMDNTVGTTLPDEITSLTDTVWYGYAKDHPDVGTVGGSVEMFDPEYREPYDRPTRIVLNSYTHDSAVSGITFNHSIVFTENKAQGTGGKEYIQVSNTTDDVYHTGAWINDIAVQSTQTIRGTYYKVVIYDSVDALNAANHGESEIPVVANMDNVISYRKISESGLESPVYTMVIYPDTTTEETTIELLSNGTGALVNSLKGQVTYVPAGAQIYRYNHGTSVWEPLSGSEFEVVPTGRTTDYYLNELFLVVDLEGNISYLTVPVPENYWGVKPTLSVELGTYPMNNVRNTAEFNLTAAYEGSQKSHLLTYGAKLHVAFDAEYAKHTGVESMTYDLPARSEWKDLNGNTPVYQFTPDNTNRAAGIFNFMMSAENRGIRIDDLYLVHKYDKDLLENTPMTVTLTFTLEDVAGNLSDPVEITVTLYNHEPQISYVYTAAGVAYTPVSGLTSRRFSVPTVVANVPIAEVYPSTLGQDAAEEYRTYCVTAGWEKAFVDSYKAEQLEVTIVDMFGLTYTRTVESMGIAYVSSSGVQYNMSMDVQFSDSVNGKVTMGYQSVDPGIYVDIIQPNGTAALPTAMTPGASSVDHTVLAAKVNKATVELDADEPVVIMVYDPAQLANNVSAYLEDGFDHIIIPECVKRPVNGEIHWYFEEFNRSFSTSELAEMKSNGTYDLPSTTSHNVHAYLVTDKYVETQSGSSHIFTYGGENEWTFEYMDLSGAQGQMTARLSDIPITLTEPVADTADNQRPEFSMDIYGKYNYIYESKNAYDYGEWSTSDVDVATAVQDIGYVQGYMLDFTITDQSPTRMLLLDYNSSSNLDYYTSVSETVDGVTIRGNQVFVDKPTQFIVALIDSNNNLMTIFFEEEAFQIDTNPPFVSEKAEIANGLYGKTVYVFLSDNETPDDITWIAPSGVNQVADGTYAGYYALVFEDNATKNITFRDKVGNIASEDIAVEGIDKTKAAVTSVRWVPANGQDTTLPPVKLSNTNVVAFVQFNTQIKNLVVTDAVNQYMNLHVDVVLQNDQAVITFKNSNKTYDDVTGDATLRPWNLTLAYTAVNGATGTHTLTLDPVIDKDAPHFYLNYDGTTAAAYVDVSITGLSEDCYLSGAGSEIQQAGVDITRRITENGHYSFIFTDKAGNQTRKDIDIDCIDNTPPVIIVDMPDSTAPTNGNILVKATMDEAGELLITDKHDVVKTIVRDDGTEEVVIDGSLTGINAPVPGADGSSTFDWLEYEIEENGSYRVVAVDKVGRITETYFSIGNIDRSAPAITFAPATITLIQGTPATELLQILSTGASAWDNRSLTENVKISYDSSLITDELLNRVGVFTVTYTAEDEAGNTSTAQRFVKVFSADEIQVTLNGEKTFRSEIVLLKSDQIDLRVANLPGGDGEPYSVYLRVGRWKEGQLKTRAEKLYDTTVDSNGDEYYTFTAEKNKYYTVYIVTQSRGTYITHFYVQ